MSLFLSVPEALSQQPQAVDLLEAVRRPWRIPLTDPTGKSCGYRQEVNLRPGLNVLIDEYTLQEDLIVETGTGDPCDPALSLEISFMLSGHNRHEEVASCHSFFEACWCDLDGGRPHRLA